MESNLPALIFIPGYYGSHLKDSKSGERIFITASEALFGRHALSLFGSTLQTPTSPDLIVDGVLDSVSVLPWIYKVDVYGKFMDQLKSFADQNGRQFIPFAYDWRQDHLQSVKQLSALVEKLKHKGVKNVEIVAHSMGGLIATYYLAYGNQEPETAKVTWEGAALVSRLILMATPFEGVFGVFRNMQRGATLAGNHTLLPPEAVASFPSSYVLLPFASAELLIMKQQGVKAEAVPEIQAKDQMPYRPALSDFEYWRKNGLGLLANQNIPKAAQLNREKFLRSQLARAYKISKLLQFQTSSRAEMPQHLKMLAITASGTSTATRAFYNADTRDYVFDTDKKSKQDLSQLMGDGDGTVTVTSSRIPSTMLKNAKVLSSRKAHDRIFTDEAFQVEYKKFLLQ